MAVSSGMHAHAIYLRLHGAQRRARSTDVEPQRPTRCATRCATGHAKGHRRRRLVLDVLAVHLAHKHKGNLGRKQVSQPQRSSRATPKARTRLSAPAKRSASSGTVSAPV